MAYNPATEAGVVSSGFFDVTPAQVGGLMAIGAIGGMFSSYQASATARDNLRFQQDMAEINARQAEKAAQRSMERGRRAKNAQQLRAASLKGRQRAAIAANGIALDSGSAIDILTTTDYFNQVDQDTITINALNEAYGYRTQGLNYQAQAGMAGANASGINPYTSATSSLLSDAGQVATSWYVMNNQRR